MKFSELPAQERRRATDHYEQCPRYDKHELSEEQMLAIAKKAVELARADFYQEVGHSVTNKVFWIIGAASVSVWYWLTNKPD